MALPPFNSFDSIIRKSSPPRLDSTRITRHPLNSPISSTHHPKPWKAENFPSASSTLAGQPLNVPAPSLPNSYPGSAYPFPSLRNSPLIHSPGCVSFLVIPSTNHVSRLRSSSSLPWNSMETALQNIIIFMFLSLPRSKSTKRHRRTSHVSHNDCQPARHPTSSNHPQRVPSSFWRRLLFPPRTLTSRPSAVEHAIQERQSASLRPIQKTSRRTSAPLTLRAASISSSAQGPPSFLSASFAILATTARKRVSSMSIEGSIPTRSLRVSSSVRLILRNQQREVVAAIQTPPIMITDDRKAVKRIIAAAEANGTVLGLPADRKRTLDSIEDSDDIVVPRHTRPRTLDYVPTTREYPGAGPLPSSNPYKPGKQLNLYTQPGSLHPSLAHAAAHLASLHGVFPNKGPTKGGIQIAITGVQLTPNSTVSFGGIPVVDLTYKCDHLLICVLPRAPSPGPVPVSLGGAQTDPKAPFPTFTYESEEIDSGM